LAVNLHTYGVVIDWVRQFCHIWFESLSQAFVSGLALYYLNLSLKIELSHEEEAD
jgi:hypothetical protein